MAELVDVGYANLTMERVAERARTGKASLYRHWPTRLELALDAVHSAFPDPAETADTGSLRGDLMLLLGQAAELLRGPYGEALRGLLGEALTGGSRIWELRHRSQGGERRAMRVIAERGVDRGEMPAERMTPRRLEVGQAMLRHQFLFEGRAMSDEAVAEIVDEVVVPLWTGEASSLAP